MTRRNDLHRLDVYRCALTLYRMVGRIIAQFPRGEADLRSQMRRASRSIPFNIGALDCVEIDQLAALTDVIEAQNMADRVAAMLTKLIRSTLREPSNRDRDRDREPSNRDRDRDRDRLW